MTYVTEAPRSMSGQGRHFKGAGGLPSPPPQGKRKKRKRKKKKEKKEKKERKKEGNYE